MAFAIDRNNEDIYTSFRSNLYPLYKLNPFRKAGMELYRATPLLRVYALALLCLLATANAHAQTVTVSASPSSVDFTLARNGTTDGNSAISITTSWVVLITPLTITLYAYLSSTTAALTDSAGNNIPSANVSGSSDGGAYVAFTGNSPFSTGTSITVSTQTNLVSLNGSHNDTLSLSINTAGLNLPAGTYTGTLTLEAQIL